MSLRLSSYNIHVKNPYEDGKDVWINGLSGEVVRTSPGESKFLNQLVNPCTTVSDDQSEGLCKDLLLKFSRSGIVTNMTVADEEEHFIKVVSNIHKNRLYKNPTYVFMPTYECNLNCSYCFQEKTRAGKAWSMDSKLVNTIFDSIKKYEKEYLLEVKNNERNFILYGGEPLLAKNKKIVDLIVEKAISLGANGISAVTNAFELDSYSDLLKEKKIDSLQITLDGAKEIHDRLRVLPDGNGTFEKISKNIQIALDYGIKVNIRTNIDRNNCDKLHHLAQTVVEKGWDKYHNFNLYAGLIHGGNSKTLTNEILEADELFEIIYSQNKLNPNMGVYKQSEFQLLETLKYSLKNEQNLGELFKPYFCGAHSNTFIFDGDGNIYSCMEQDQAPHYKIGEISNECKVIENENQNVWRNRTVASNPTCRKCAFALFCGGGCAIRAMIKNGSMFSNHCGGFQKLFRKCVEIAMTLSFLLHEI